MDEIDATFVLARAKSYGIESNWMKAPDQDVNTASIYEIEHGWRVSTTDERGAEESVKEYTERGLALKDFVERVQGFVRAKELWKELFGR